jgi:nucleoid-associated protein YgaU
MGRLEKIVVLTVLFLVAVILGVSLNQGGDTVKPKPDESLAQAEPPAALPQSPPESATGTAPVGPVGTLNTSTGKDGILAPTAAGTAQPNAPATGAQTASGARGAAPSAEPSVPAQSAPAAGTLLTTEGLSDSLDPDVMIYTWVEGDSFVALAERYFGSRLEVGRLHRVNEGRAESELRAGDRIFVPRRAAKAGELLAKSASAAGQWEGGVYRVESGDMLGKIAKKVYGSASKWRVIYEANRDVLASPDALEVGMALRIPRLE